MLSIHLYYGIARITYTLILKAHRKIVLFEFLISILVSSVLLFLLNKITILQTEVYLLIVFSAGIIFLLTSFFLRKSKRLNLHANEKVSKDSILTLPDHLQTEESKVKVGIIDTSWLSIMNISYSLVLIVSTLPILTSDISRTDSSFITLCINEISFLIDKGIQMVLALATVLAGCMGILWGEAIWNKKGSKNHQNYSNHVLKAMQMIICFFFVAGSVFVWFIVPLYSKMSILKFSVAIP